MSTLLVILSVPQIYFSEFNEALQVVNGMKLVHAPASVILSREK
jgi:hypothetical protein